jgi:dephospho-CoA kinase
VITIGLTGGIGSGKSTASGILARLGATVIDADQVGHDVYRPGTACWQDVVSAFGGDVVAADGTIDRKKLGARVFSDPAALKRLNGLVQPRIAAEIDERIRTLRTGGLTAPIVVEAAVLIEAGWQWLVDEIWVVVTSRDHAIERVVASRGVSRTDVERRLASQLSDAERAQQAERVFANDGTLADLQAELERAWRERAVPRAEAAS